jgi:spore germination cell wall hydrolase CwlJ-like protein
MLLAAPLVALTLIGLTAIPAISEPLRLTITPASFDDASNGPMSPADAHQITPASTFASSGDRPRPRPEAPAPPAQMAPNDRLCLAVAIYHEARGESVDGQRAVASVILQRGIVAGRWGKTPCEVIVPVQFSFLDASGKYDPITEIGAWNTAYNIAAEMMARGPLPELDGADHYHTKAVDPSWNETMHLVDVIDTHLFWRDPDSVTLAVSM